MTLNITMIIYNRILMVMAWVWALTIVELIAKSLSALRCTYVTIYYTSTL